MCVATCAQAVRYFVLNSYWRSGGSVVSEFLERYLSSSHNKVIRVTPWTVLWEQALKIKLDRLVEMSFPRCQEITRHERQKRLSSEC